MYKFETQKRLRTRNLVSSAGSIRRGMTLLELTVVIFVLLSLVGILFIGGRAWKRGSDRSLCVMNIRNVQNGVRSFSNLYGFEPGDNVPNLQSRVIGLGRFVEKTPACPTGGTYAYGGTLGADTVPLLGSLYLNCSLASSGHVPEDTTEW